MAHASVPDIAVTSSDNFSVSRIDRKAEADKTKGGGVCFMINKKWCDPRNISILSRSCSPHLEYLSIICPARFHRSLLLLFTFHHRQTLAWLCPNSTMCSAATLKNTLTLPLSSRGTLTKPASSSIYQHLSCPARGPNTLDHCYTQFKKGLHCPLTTGFWQIGPCPHFPHTRI